MRGKRAHTNRQTLRDDRTLKALAHQRENFDLRGRETNCVNVHHIDSLRPGAGYLVLLRRSYPGVPDRTYKLPDVRYCVAQTYV